MIQKERPSHILYLVNDIQKVNARRLHLLPLLLFALGSQSELVLSDTDRLAEGIRQMFGEQGVVLGAGLAVEQSGVQSLGVTLGDLDSILQIFEDLLACLFDGGTVEVLQLSDASSVL